MNPRLARARTNLGALLARQQQFDEAIRQLEAAMRLNPGCPLTRLNLAVALARTCRTGEAAARLEEAVRLAPDSLLAPDESSADLVDDGHAGQGPAGERMDPGRGRQTGR